MYSVGRRLIRNGQLVKTVQVLIHFLFESTRVVNKIHL